MITLAAGQNGGDCGGQEEQRRVSDEADGSDASEPSVNDLFTLWGTELTFLVATGRQRANWPKSD